MGTDVRTGAATPTEPGTSSHPRAGPGQSAQSPGRGILVNVNRRTALGVLGAVGAATLATGESHAQGLPAPLPLPPAPSGPGAHGRMTGAKAAVAALRAEAIRCVYGVPGA